ncbi:unnamed protein product [Soboliphyme baturini]|uniref:CortBP2 domain-containing protein n=1 Tax=Soboliphyme baturini TaxID=241478 RepID=A0A183IQ26_9BILA|nr:unnamed protein product [Soboliphyme baturini]
MADEPSCSKDLSKSNKPFCNGSKDVNNFDLSSLAHGQLNQRDLLKLLSCLEGELQARDIVIATLKAEKAKHLLQQARYGKLGLRDPFTALQRDSFAVVDRATTDAGSNETDISQIYESQLTHLEKLIATQRKAHQRAKQVSDW